MMDDNARAIINRARETLEQAADIEVGQRQQRDYSDDALLKWRAGMPEAGPATMSDVEKKISEHRDVWRAVLGQTIVNERKLHRAETDRLNRKLDELLSCFNELLRATDALERSFSADRSKIIDLPQHSWGRSRAG